MVRLKSAFVALSLCVMTCFATEAKSEDPLLFGVLSVAPFSIQEEAKPPSGLYVELLGTIIEHANIDARIELFPLDAGVRLAKADGSIDAIAKRFGQ